MKNWIIYIPLVLLFIVQILDKEDQFFWLQILLLLATVVIGLFLKFGKRKDA